MRSPSLRSPSKIQPPTSNGECGSRSGIQNPEDLNPQHDIRNSKSLLFPTSKIKRQTSNVKLVTAVLVILSLLSCTKSESDLSTVKSINVGPPARIISLAPSVTEILYELELEDHVVGVTRYCDYPPRALEKSSVGGYFDVNYEAVLALEPDLVICLIEHEDALKRL
jgi:ABC-type hemin transport system substrate-binding protein